MRIKIEAFEDEYGLSSIYKDLATCSDSLHIKLRVLIGTRESEAR